VQKFYFKLQPLLNKELIYENECIGRLRIIRDNILIEDDKLRNLKKQKITSQSELKSKKLHDIASVELRAYEEYFLKLGSDINTCNIRLLEITKKLRIVQEELAKIVKRRKALEKLSDRWEKEYKDYLVSLSNKEMDDIAMTKFTNKVVVKND